MVLAAKNRLSKRIDFDTVFKEGKAIKGSFLFIKIVESSDKVSRFGFLISSKVSKKAVIRNKIRRVLSDFVRLNINKIRSGYDIIVVIKNGSVDPKELINDLDDTLEKAKIIL